MTAKRSFARLLAGAEALAAMPAVARAQGEPERAYPDRPVRLVVPYAPGGTNDIVARILGQKMSDTFGQPFVVENRPGAQAIIGTELVARSRPDGYTLLVGASGPIVFNPATYDRLGYDPLQDLAPVSNLTSFPLMLLVSADSPFRSVQEVIAFAKAHPDRANYGSPAASFQLAAELFNQKAGTRFVYVAYRGSADTITATARREVTMSLVDTAPAAGPLAGGRVRALAVTSPRRLEAHPEVPTMAEVGFPDVEVVLWTGLLAPAGTPAGIVRKLQEEAARIVRLPDVRERLASLVLEPVGSTPEEFRRTIAAEIELWRGVARAANIRFER
jgi:tripartite-type tricarboxylate transporter receptor subunit TctC